MKNTIVIIIILLIFLTGKISAQILMIKPYLKVVNTISGHTYKLKRGKRIEYLVLHDSNYRKGIINDFVDSNSILVSGIPLNINNIVYLKFKPKSKARRITKILFYSTSITAALMYLSTESNCNDAGCPGHKATVAMFTPLFIIWGEIGGLAIQLLTQKRELYKGYNLKLEVIK